MAMMFSEAEVMSLDWSDVCQLDHSDAQMETVCHNIIKVRQEIHKIFLFIVNYLMLIDFFLSIGVY